MLILCFAAIEIISDALASSLLKRVHHVILCILRLRAVLWLVTKEPKLAVKLLSAMSSLPSAATTAPEVDTRLHTSHLTLFLLASARFLQGKFGHALRHIDALKEENPDAHAYAPLLYLEGT